MHVWLTEGHGTCPHVSPACVAFPFDLFRAASNDAGLADPRSDAIAMLLPLPASHTVAYSTRTQPTCLSHCVSLKGIPGSPFPVGMRVWAGRVEDGVRLHARNRGRWFGGLGQHTRKERGLGPLPQACQLKVRPPAGDL